MNTVIIVMLLLIGIVILFGSIYTWDLMFRSRLTRDMVKSIGIDRTKTIYGAIGMAMIVVAGILILIQQEARPLQAKPDATVMLSIKSDGCTVSRSDVVGSSLVQHFQWVITDKSYKTVLTRTDDSEHEYRYPRSGEYYVVFQAWYKGGYVTISNKVEINCSSATP